MLLISVIIPVYNSQQFIADAINSVLSQKMDNLEIICVDDGSTDKSAEIIRSFGDKIKYIYQDNQGPASARNKGILASNGEYIALLDSDDLYPSGKLQRQINLMKQNPGVMIIAGKVQYQFLPESKPEKFYFKNNIQENSNLVIGSGLCRRSLFDIVGLFDTKLKFGEDSDWYNRVNEAGIEIMMDEEIGLIYRHHEHNLTNDTESVKRAILQVIKLSLNRKRKNIMPAFQHKISVIISAYNTERYIIQCIESVLNQTYAAYEVIVIDDGSTDSTLNLLKKYQERIIIISRENRGVACSLNEGIKKATGTLIAFLDADDHWALDKLQLQIEQLRQNKKADAIFGMSAQFYSEELTENEKNNIQFNPEPTHSFYKGTMLIYKDAFRKTGLFDETLKSGEFIDWFSKAKLLRLNFNMYDNVFLYRRLRPNTLSQQTGYNSDILNILRAHLKRQRAS